MTKIKVRDLHILLCNAICTKLGGGPPCDAKTSVLRRRRLFLSKKTRLQLPELKPQNATINYVPEVRYVGVILDHRLNWTNHCRVYMGKALRPLKTMKLALG